MSNIRFHRFLLLSIITTFGFAFATSLVAQESKVDAELKEELKYIELLQQMRMPDIAEQVIADVKKAYPEAGPQLKVREFQGLLWQGKFDEVKVQIDAIPDKNSSEFWALTLAMADAYYAFQRYAEADKLYQEFFKKVAKPSEAMHSFYRDSAYKYAQMLLYLGKDAEALKAYKLLSNVKLEEDRERNVNADMAELMLKLAVDLKDKAAKAAMLKEAEVLVDKLLWKQDVWFGKAIVMKAHVAMLRDDIKGAQALVENYMPQLKIIHDSLLEDDPDGTRGWLRMSPMPECRYLLAVLLLDEAKAEMKKPAPDEELIKGYFLGERDPKTKKRANNGAFNHFINVFIRFPESQWAADAGEHSDEIRSIIKDRYNVDVRTPVTPQQMERVRTMQFAGANLLFSQNKFKEAAEKYLIVINQFPESMESVNALGNLAICYIEGGADDELMADAVVGHLSERFAVKKDLMKAAGDQVRKIGDYYGNNNRDDKKREVYTMFFRDYPTHYAASQLVMSFAEREFKAENYVGAKAYYDRVITEYKSSTYYHDALNRITQIYRAEGNFSNELSSLEFLIDELQKSERPGHNLVVAKFRLADVERSYGSLLLKSGATNETDEAVLQEGARLLTKAALSFDAVAKMLADPTPYQKNAEETERNQQMREMATFTKGVALSQLQYPKDKRTIYRRLSIAAFEAYLTAFPKSKYSPKAQLQLGTLYTVLAGNATEERDQNEYKEKIQKAFEALSKNYPDSEEAKNSVPMLAASLIEMGLRGEGVAKYREMFTGGGKYTPGQYNAAGNALLQSQEYALALEAYNKVLANSKEFALIAEAKLGKAKALVGQKQYREARKLLAAYVVDPELSKLVQVVDAHMLLADAASEEGKTEADNELRKDLFNQAVDSLKLVRGYRKTKAEIAEIDLATGNMLVRKMEAEKKLGLNDQAAETRGTAIVAFMIIIDRFDPGDAILSPYLEKAYFAFTPLLLEHKAYAQAVDDCETYLRLFPQGRYATDMQNWLNQAKIGQ
ncbi:MAG: tetratricopeptide repeat protein [Kiritimatiellia bacterium]